MKVLVFPRDPNPYQELLYEPIREVGVTVDYVEGPTPSQTLNVLCIPGMLFIKRLQGYRLLHIHWTYAFTLPWAQRAGRLPMQLLAKFTWRMAHMLGYRLVWTAHNVLPHEQLFWNDEAAHRRLGNEADVIIAHNSAVREQLADIGVTRTPIKIIPHGSYVGAYPDTVTRAAARRRLHIPEDDTVLLCFGHIRPYKGIEALLESFEALPAGERKGLTLLVAGPPADAALVRRLRYMQRKYRQGIKLAIGYVPDDEVQLYFRAADFTVLPYVASTTSGVAVLAFSFDCPIIAPNQTAFSDLPGTAQILFDSDRLPQALTDAIHTPAAKRARMAKAAGEYAAALNWPAIARKTHKLFSALDK
jgi:glycosyltransferase involved in cell wall biosynthesis